MRLVLSRAASLQLVSFLQFPQVGQLSRQLSYSPTSPSTFVVGIISTAYVQDVSMLLALRGHKSTYEARTQGNAGKAHSHRIWIFFSCIRRRPCFRQSVQAGAELTGHVNLRRVARWQRTL